MSAPCNGPALAYTPFKRLENANRSGPPHRQSGIFLPVIRKGYNCLFPAIGESAGGSDRKALRRSTMRFLAPLVPRPLTLMAGSSPAVGDRAMSDPLFDPPPRLTYFHQTGQACFLHPRRSGRLDCREPRHVNR